MVRVALRRPAATCVAPALLVFVLAVLVLADSAPRRAATMIVVPSRAARKQIVVRKVAAQVDHRRVAQKQIVVQKVEAQMHIAPQDVVPKQAHLLHGMVNAVDRKPVAVLVAHRHVVPKDVAVTMIVAALKDAVPMLVVVPVVHLRGAKDPVVARVVAALRRGMKT